MIERMIEQTVLHLTTDQVKKFAQGNGVTLQEKEATILCDIIKKNWRIIIYGDPSQILASLKGQVEPSTYQKIEELYPYFKQKFRHYL